MRPRYGRIATLVSALGVTVLALLGGAGLLPSTAGDADPAAAVDSASQQSTQAADSTPRPDAEPRPASSRNNTSEREADDEQAPTTDETALPPDSGEGRRIVFSEGRQRVWLVDGESQVVRTYPVSGSVYDNLDPGSFRVYSRSEEAVGIDDSGTMRYFVRFTTGDEGAAIGFHDIPVQDGQPVQTRDQLGTPLSHGCIRQATADAIALWEFAPIGTPVVVTV